MKTEIFTRNLSGLNRLWRVLPCAVIGLFALCVQSCRTHGHIATASRTEDLRDSLLSEIRVLKPIRIPESRVSLAIPTASLLDLPPSASYTQKSGQANVKVEQDKDTMRIYASCDSLQMLCEYYERELVRIRGQTMTDEKHTEQYSVSIQTALKYILSGFIAGVFITIIIYNKRKNG